MKSTTSSRSSSAGSSAYPISPTVRAAKRRQKKQLTTYNHGEAEATFENLYLQEA
jgi:hypothetical protein